MDKKLTVILIALLVLITLYWTRYQIVGPIAIPGNEHNIPIVGFYKINRFTGEITAISSTKSVQVKSVEETAREKIKDPYDPR